MAAIDPLWLKRVFGTLKMAAFIEGGRRVLRQFEIADAENITIMEEAVILSQKEAEEFAEEFEKIGLSQSALLLRDHHRLKLPNDTFIPELQRRIEHELQSVFWLHVPSERRKFYTEKEGFGEEVAIAFPSAAYDIEEAGKCFALGRFTACVFHLMRVLEVGLDVLKKVTGTLDYSPTWKVALDQIAKAVSDKKERDRTPEERERDRFIRDAVYYLQNVRDAARNPVVHVPAKVYTAETCFEVYTAMRAFMRHLSTKLSE